MAQLVEHILGKDEVPSSNLGSSSKQKAPFGVPAIEQVHPKRRAFNQKRYNISVLCRFYFYIIFSIA